MAPKRPRTVRREADRQAQKLIDARESLAALEPGGAKERPLSVESASLVELRALREECLACGSTLEILQHDAEHVDGKLVRKVVAQCKRCTRKRTFWIRVAPTLLQ